MPLSDLIVRIRTDTSKFQKGLSNAQAKLDAFSKSAKKVGTGLAKMGAAIGGVGAVSSKLAVDFEDSINQVVSLVGVAREQVDAWKDDVLDLAGQTAQAPRELAEGLFFVTSAGLRGTAAMDTLRSSAQAAAAGLGTTETVADAVTSALNAYGQENLSAADATGILVQAVRDGKASAASLAPVMGRLLPMSSELGIRFDEVAASLAAMSRIGLNASEASTAMTGVMKAMIKPSVQAKKALAGVGLSTADLRAMIEERGLLGALQSLRASFKGNEEGLARLFRDVQGLNAVLSLTGEQAEVNAQIFDNLAEAGGHTLATAFEESKTAGFEMRAAMAQVQAAGIALGNNVLPVLVPLVQKLGAVIGAAAARFQAMGPTTKRVALALGALAIAAGPIVLALGAIGGAVAGIMAGWGPFVAAVGAMSGAFGAATGAVAAFATGLGALGAALALVSGGVGFALGRKLNESVPLLREFTEAISTAHDPTFEFGEALAENRDLFNDTAARMDRVTRKLGLVGEQWQVSRDFTRANAQALADLNRRVSEHINELGGLGIAQSKQLTVEEQILQARARSEAALAKAGARFAEFRATVEDQGAKVGKALNSIRGHFDVMNAQDVQEGMREAAANFKLLSAQGVSAEQIVGKLGPEFEKLTTIAGQYRDVDVPDDFKRMGEAIKEGKDRVDLLARGFRTDLPTAAKQMDVALQSSIGDRLQRALEAGRAKLAEITAEVDALARREIDLNVKARFDFQALLDRLAEYGIVPEADTVTP